jgi:hypothetical protein
MVKNTVTNPSKAQGPRDRRTVRKAARYLRQWSACHGRTVHDQMIRGVSYGVGSGAISLLVIWIEARH